MAKGKATHNVRKPWYEDPAVKRKYAELYRLVRFQGVSKTEAYLAVFKTKAHRRSAATLGQKVFSEYETRCAGEIAEAFAAFDIDEHRLAADLAEALGATRDFVVTRDDGNGGKDLELVSQPDYRTRLAAQKLGWMLKGHLRTNGEGSGPQVVVLIKSDVRIHKA